jgi:hypothetical protein
MTKPSPANTVVKDGTVSLGRYSIIFWPPNEASTFFTSPQIRSHDAAIKHVAHQDAPASLQDVGLSYDLCSCGTLPVDGWLNLYRVKQLVMRSYGNFADLKSCSGSCLALQYPTTIENDGNNESCSPPKQKET